MEPRFAQELSKNLDNFKALAGQIPSVQITQVATLEALSQRISSAVSFADQNRVFWNDQLATLEAWRSVFAYRIQEVLDAAILLLNQQKLIACGPVARAAFELGQTSLITSARLYEVATQVSRERVREQSCFSQSFPIDVELALYGTTIRDLLESTGVQRPPKLAKARNRLQEHPLAGDIAKYYEKISDFSHPYWLGNRPFCRLGKQGTIEKVCREYDPLWTGEVEEVLKTVISWTAMAASNVLEQTAYSIRTVRAALSD